MADKTWTATDLELGKLSIMPQGGGVLQFERRYQFIDSNGDVLSQIAGGRVVESVTFASLPTNIQTALQDIDTWTKQQALIQEGMDD